MPDITLPTPGQKPWAGGGADPDLNVAIETINIAVDDLIGITAGGTSGQVWAKLSDDDYDVGWTNADTVVTSVPDASTTVKGKVELATNTETTTGTDAVRATTPAGVAAAIAAAVVSATTSVSGISELATDAETVTGTDTVRTVTPHGLAAALDAIKGNYKSVNAQTGTTYTPVFADVGALVTLSNTSAITVTLPQDSSLAVPVGGRIDFAGINTGLVTFAAGSGATANGTPSLVTRARYSAVTAIKIAANTWLLVGDLA